MFKCSDNCIVKSIFYSNDTHHLIKQFTFCISIIKEILTSSMSNILICLHYHCKAINKK